MMLESFAMNRQINNDDIEMFLRSFSYTDICQELSTATGRTVQDEQYDHRVNETHPAFCAGEPSNESLNARQHHSTVGEANKGGFLETSMNSLCRGNNFIHD